ncbi:MAG TPA: NADH-quinone oxidoreductase subunit L, partial [Verrucomicrobiales bacterium]|nr:NADH-quinone oxidoreductase subunit L [Verrucomicrobiales bacterium]
AQFPLHVWLPDAMEGPTPVSALIHAATMVAAGVFLMARIHPLFEFPAAGTQALDLITWIGAITALGGALVACAQQDLKRILAFSTISQLGYMMLGLGTGGVAVAMFHLITHAFFKALLFLGAGSVIHGCHDQQDIRYMGGLRKRMPTTFIAYGIGMMALAGFPLVTAGFWSKDLILHAALHWHGGRIPFAMGLLGALLTAFYMTRQMAQVFFGRYRGDEAPDQAASSGNHSPHESPSSMLWPLRILAVFAIGAGFIGTPVYPWFESFLEGQALVWQPGELVHGSTLLLLLGSSCLVLMGLFFGWWYYSPLVYDPARDDDPMEERLPAGSFGFLRAKAYLDEAYQYTFLRWTQHMAMGCRWVENHFFRPMMPLVATFTQLISWLARFWDEWIINAGFDFTCSGIMIQAGKIRRMHQKRVQICLQWMAAAAILLLIILKLGGAS